MNGGQKPLHLWGSWAPADFLGDELVRVLAARGDCTSLAVYFMVLQASRVGGGDLPAAPEELAAVLGMPSEVVSKGLEVWVQRKKLKVAGGRLFHPRVLREVREDLAYRKAAQQAGRKGAEARWKGDDRVPDRVPHSHPNRGRIRNPNDPPPPPPPLTPSPPLPPTPQTVGRRAAQVRVNDLLDAVVKLSKRDRRDELKEASRTPRGDVLTSVVSGSEAWLNVVADRLGTRLSDLEATLTAPASWSVEVPPPDPDALGTWLKVVEVLAEKLDPHTFSMWVRPMVPVALAGTDLRLWVPVEDIGRTMTGDRYGPIFQAALEAAGVTTCRFQV